LLIDQYQSTQKQPSQSSCKAAFVLNEIKTFDKFYPDIGGG
jgi:hypothetical protein